MSLVAGNDDTIVVTMGIYVNKPEVEDGSWRKLLHEAIDKAGATITGAVEDEVVKRGWLNPPAKEPANG